MTELGTGLLILGFIGFGILLDDPRATGLGWFQNRSMLASIFAILAGVILLIAGG